MKEIADIVAAVGVCIIVATISGGCIVGWVYLIRNWKTIWKKRE